MIVPTLHYPKVDQVAAALLLQSASPTAYEVLICDSQEGRWEGQIRGLQADPSRLRYLRAACSDICRARQLNQGIQSSSGRLVLLFAGDFHPTQGLVQSHLNFHASRPETSAVGIGTARFVKEQASSPVVRWLESSGRLFGSRFLNGDAGGFFYAGNASLKRDLGDEAGWFDNRFPFDSMDDFEFGVRLRKVGMKSAHVPGSAAGHEHGYEISLAEQERRMSRLGEGAALFEDLHAGPYEWGNTCVRSPARLRLDALLWGGLHLLTRDEEHLFRYYSCRCDGAFAEGWRRGRRAASTIPRTEVAVTE